jgi:hypothetical protein
MSRDAANLVFAIALGALGFEASMAFGLFFQPSWAKGWPGVPEATAIGIGFGTMAFVIVVTAPGLLAPLYQRLAARAPPGRLGRPVLVGLSVVILALAGLVAVAVFQFFSANWSVP